VASIIREPNGRRRIEFFDHKGARKRVRLGKVDQKKAEAVRTRIDQLVAGKVTGHGIDRDMALWLTDIDAKLHARLERAGLIAGRAAPEATTLGPWIERYISGRTDVKATTVQYWGRARKFLLAYFGADRSLASITTADAIEFRLWLFRDQKDAAGKVTRRKQSDNTTRRLTAISKQFLQRAVKAKLIAENPFSDSDLPTSLVVNKSRERFITASEAAAVLQECPSDEWRVIFSLSRYGGLRCPSEHLRLRWSDIDFDGGRLTVTSPKTEHHAGKGSRVIPLFPELREPLQALHTAGADDSDFVLPRPMLVVSRAHTGLARIISRAGLQQWPRLYHNLRASRQTELAATFPIHVVCAWLGNSPAIALRHYLQVTAADFDKAAQNWAHPTAIPTVLECPGANGNRRKRPKTAILPAKTRITGSHDRTLLVRRPWLA